MNSITIKMRWLWVLMIALSFAISLTGCSASTGNEGSVTLAPMAGMPEEVQNAAATVRDAYRFAVANPEMLKQVPCYCGCGAVGHTSNYSCFVTEIKSDGSIVFDQHALGCSLCVDIAQDAIRLKKEGSAQTDIRSYIDQTYSQFGPSNMSEGN